MARLRYNGLAATLGADLLTAGTTITFSSALTHSGGTAVPTIGAGDYIPLAILDSTTDGLLEIVHLTAYTSGSTTGTVTRAQESTTAADQPAGARVVHGITVADVTALEAVGGGGVSTVKQSRTAGNVSLTSTTFATVDAALDLTIAAVTGDVLEVVLNTIIGGSGGGSNNANFTAYTRVSSADVNNIAGGTGSVPGFFAPDTLTTVSGTQLYAVQAGDVSGGNVTLRLYYKTDTTAGRTLFANAGNPTQFAVKNLGQ